MKPSDLLAFLSAVFTAPAPRPILITGAPGIGKSDVVARAAADAGADLILSHPAVSDPTDAKGLPWIAPPSGESRRATEATFLPFGELARAIAATRPTVWFLDDLGQASPAVQASYMQLLLARRVNGHVLPDCVTFVSATNRRTDRAGVSGLLEPIKSRNGSIVELEPDLPDWCVWALANGIPVEMVAFMRSFPDKLSAFLPSADLTNSPSPRTWSNAAWILSLDLPRPIRNEALAGAVGAAAANEFLAYLDLYRSIPSIDVLLADPNHGTIPTEASVLYAVVTALAWRATDVTWPRVARYAERLAEASRGDMATLLLEDVRRRLPSIIHTPEFVRLQCGPLGTLMRGGN